MKHKYYIQPCPYDNSQGSPTMTGFCKSQVLSFTFKQPAFEKLDINRWVLMIGEKMTLMECAAF